MVEVVGMILDKLKAWGAIAAALALAGLLLVQTGRLHKAERRADTAELTLSNDRAAAASQLAQATAKARETEQTLSAKAAKTEGEKNAQIADLSVRAAALTRRLRDAAATNRLVSATAATAATARAAEASAVCDGGFISERTGSDLVALAARGDQVRLQLASCEAQYDAAREALK